MSATLGQTSTRPAWTSAAVIVIGAGPVGIHFVQRLLERVPHAVVKIFGDEPWEPYNRVRLTQLLSGKIRSESVFTQLTSPKEKAPSLFTLWNNRIQEINTAEKYVTDSFGVSHPYTQLVFATGSSPRIPNIKGVKLKNVFSFRDLDDAQQLAGRQVSSRHTVVIGGGLLGLETARAMQRFNTQVSCIEHSTRLMFSQLDDAASRYLERYLERLGLQIRTQTRVAEIVGEEKVEAVRLGNGEVIPCDTVIFSTGIMPNIALARAAGIRVGRGIQIDDHLATNCEDVYAIGECAEHHIELYGVVAPGYEQAAVLANHLSGGQARYQGSLTSSTLKIVDYPVLSMGENGDDVNVLDRNEYVYEDAERKVYRKLVILNGHLEGIVAVGEWPAWTRAQEALKQKRYVWPWQKQRFLLEGELWAEKELESVADWPADSVICNCTGVTHGELSRALRNGATTVAALREKTGASSVCGSCQALLHELTATSEARPATQGYRWLGAAAFVTLVVSVFLLLFPGAEYSQSVQANLTLDNFWSDSLLKQISGFSLLGVSLLLGLLSLRKRILRFRWGEYAHWRVWHALLGTVLLLGIFIHTGFRFGAGLNFWLMLSFSTLLLIGALAAGVIAQEHLLSRPLAVRLRKWSLWGHILLFWPIPVLLMIHILKSYYF